MDSNCDFKLSIRQMKFEEVEAAAKIFSNAGLNDSVSTLQAYYECDPQGFVVAVNEDKDEVIGSCAAPLTTHNTSFIGLYVVDPNYQKLGLGVKMFNQCLDKVGSDNNCGLSAVPSKFAIYKDRAGFKVVEGRSLVITEGKPNGISKLKTVDKLEPKYRLHKLTSVDYNQDLVTKIISYDQKVHLDNRDKLLRCTFSKSDITTFVMTDADQVVGYGCIKPDVSNRAMIGPLYADTDEISEVLLGELLRSSSYYANEADLSFITMDNSVHGIRMATDILGLIETSRCEKLYTKFVPPFNYDLLYCCHTPDFSC